MPRFDADEWARRIDGGDCPACALVYCAASPLDVLDLPSGRVRLQDDAQFRGYCILYCGRHVTELHDLSSAERGQLIEDLARLSRAIAEVCGPAKLNYACLGNEVPHLHWHVVPRYPDDGWWGRSFSARPADRRRALPPAEVAPLLAALRKAIAE